MQVPENLRSKEEVAIELRWMLWTVFGPARKHKSTPTILRWIEEITAEWVQGFRECTCEEEPGTCYYREEDDAS